MVSVTVSAALYLTGTSPGKGREGTGEELSFSKQGQREASVSAREPGCSRGGLGQLSRWQAKAAHSPEKGGAAQGANRERSGNYSSLTTLFPAAPLPLAQQLPCSPAAPRPEGDCGGSFPGAEQCWRGSVGPGGHLGTRQETGTPSCPEVDRKP